MAFVSGAFARKARPAPRQGVVVVPRVGVVVVRVSSMAMSITGGRKRGKNLREYDKAVSTDESDRNR